VLTDWQLEQLAGEAIGLKLSGAENRDAFLWIEAEACEPWTPLVSDEQAMRLVKQLRLHIDQRPNQISVQDPDFEVLVYADFDRGDLALNHAIVKCAAIMARRKAQQPVRTSAPPP